MHRIYELSTQRKKGRNKKTKIEIDLAYRPVVEQTRTMVALRCFARFVRRRQDTAVLGNLGLTDVIRSDRSGLAQRAAGLGWVCTIQRGGSGTVRYERRARNMTLRWSMWITAVCIDPAYQNLHL